MTTVFITSSVAWPKPADWNDACWAKFECVGSGGNGATGTSTRGGGGGGGAGYSLDYGAYAGAYDFSLSIAVDTPGNGSATRIIGARDGNAPILANSGLNASGQTGGAGAASGSGQSSVVYGVNGGNNTSSTGGGGGAGAAGPHGPGAAGLNGTSTFGRGGQGDANNTPATPNTSGAAGTAGTQWDATHGCGSGGTGAGSAVAGGKGGSYGAGGGGGFGTTAGGGNGAGGLAVITYTPLQAGPYLTWDAGTATRTFNNLTAQSPSGVLGARSLSYQTKGGTGKYYFEIYCNVQMPCFIGLATPAATYTLNPTGGMGTDAGGQLWIDGAMNVNSWQLLGFPIGARSSIIGVAVNLSLGWWMVDPSGYWNGVSNGSPVTGVAALDFAGGTQISPFVVVQGQDSATINSGASPFFFTPPSGYVAWPAAAPAAGGQAIIMA